uniref:reverse transcriptase domain-containing protein n=1 Tax=uncultured Microscilla sp. TaxID=432653 RepID=UPI00261069E5
RNLGIPTVLDRYIQQSFAQVLSSYYEPTFSDYSYGFRPNRSTHDAVEQSLSYLNSGYEYVVVIDISNYFGTVNHDQLLYSLSKESEDKVFLKLIRKYLQSGVMINGVKQATLEGTPQGGNLSPVLSNVYLDRLDKELESRGHRFVRYADDLSIYVKSQRAGERILSNVSDWLTKRLKLRVNMEKSGVYRYNRAELLGFGYYKDSKGIELRISKNSLRRF